MEKARQLVADTLALQGVSKAAAAAFAGIQPSALSHWLKGKPSIAPEKLSQVLSYVGLKYIGNEIGFRDNDELLSPRIWRAEDSVMEASVRCLAQARKQFGEVKIGLPSDIRGAAIFFSKDGRWGTVQRCNPVLLVGHKETAAIVGAGVVKRILDGDTKALIDSSKILALADRVDLDALDVAHSIRKTTGDSQNPDGPPAADMLCDALVQWAGVSAAAAKAGLSPSRTQLVIRRFIEMPAVEQDRFLQGTYHP
ncbi:MAG: hypothetical protein ACD_10C00632G0001 [uncultured bacterium]|nr:MAG: hypothetical protein ACD_10C00632G0001 [uncultured bacterium]